MDELAELRERVDQAIETGQAARRRQSQSLMARQTDFEAKYEARCEELDHCGRRIEALTRENADLMGLVDRLVQTVANWSSEDNDTPEADACDGRELVVSSEGSTQDQDEGAKFAPSNSLRSGIVVELAELRERVDQTIERGQAAQRCQRQTDLEAKYEARSEELDHCGRRIEALTRENGDMMSLVDRLVQTVANWSSEDNDTPEADACDGRELVVGSEGPMETSAEEKKQTTEPNEAPVNEVVASISDEPDRQQKAKFRLDPGADFIELAADPKKSAQAKADLKVHAEAAELLAKINKDIADDVEAEHSALFGRRPFRHAGAG